MTDTTTIADVLDAWRASICFGDSVRTPRGEKGAVCGKDERGFLTLILDDRTANPRRLSEAPAALYPGWWPDKWWHDSRLII
jgi:hypothetical protein